MAVERRDPVARQRQFFARRREQRGVRAVNGARREAGNASSFLDPFRHARRPPQRGGRREEPREAPRHAQARRKPPHISADMRLLANPEPPQSVTPGSPARKRRHRMPPRPKLAPDRTPVPEEAEVSDFDRLKQLQTSTAAASVNEIRIFDAEEECTHRFRQRVLPESFLNSQRPSTLGKKRRENLCDSAPHEMRASKRFKREADSEAPLVGAERKESGSSPLQRLLTRVYRHASPAPKTAVVDVHESHGDTLQHNSRRPTAGLVHSPQRIPGRTSYQNDPSPPTSPPISFAGNAVARHQNESSAPKELAEAGVVQTFPPIDIDSESDELPATGIAQQSEAKRAYVSILAREPFHLDQLSAEVLRLEYNMLDIPDKDVRAFARRNQGNASTHEKMKQLTTRPLMPSFWSAQEDGETTKLREGNGLCGTSQKGIEMPTLPEKAGPGSVAGPTHPELEVSVPSPNKNPIRLAMKRSGSRSPAKGSSSATP